MATIPRAALDLLTQQVNAISADAQAKVMRVLEGIEWTLEHVAECRKAVVDALLSALPAYTDAAAQAAADFYDSCRELCVGEVVGASALSGFDAAAVEGAVHAIVQDVADGGFVERFDREVLDRVDYETKKAAANSVVANTARDPLKPKWARVPSGAETCKFCVMLASRGFVYLSEETAEGMYHGHPGCDCRIVPGWDGDTVEGYDPDELYFEWKGREGFSIPEGKLTKYALNMNHPKGRDKAIAFKNALGFTVDDASEVMRQVYRWVGKHEPTYEYTDDHGERFETMMDMVGKNGKTAKVVAAWIRGDSDDKMRLTSVYVTNRKG